MPDVQPVSPRPRFVSWTDAVLLLVVFAAGTLIGSRYFAAYQTAAVTVRVLPGLFLDDFVLTGVAWYPVCD